MAHNLNQTNGKWSFASANEKAWHGLGQIVDGAMTSEQAIKLAGLDYEVVKQPVFTMVGETKTEITGKFATVRKDTGAPLGIVGSRYQIVQNEEAFKFFDAITGKGEAMYETAGALGAGETVFITAKMPKYIRIAGTDDVSEVYVMLKSTHDGSGAVIAAITPIRVVCQNTLNAALSNMINSVSIRHTKNAGYNLEQAHKLLGISHKYIDQVNELFNHMTKIQIKDSAARDLVKKLFASQKEDSSRALNIQQDVLKSYFSGVGQDGIVGTGWGLYNGITHYLNHGKNYRTGESRLESIIGGSSEKKQNEAIELILAM